MKGPRFLYHAQASGLSGRITRPFEEVIEVKAPSALPAMGGYSTARHQDFRMRNVLSYAEVRTEAAGSYNEKTDAHETAVMATIDGFNLNDVVTAAAITARLSSVHSATLPDEPSISPRGSFFTGLRIAGRDIELESNVEQYDRLDTLKSLREHYRDSEQFRQKLNWEVHRGRHSDLPERKKKLFPWSRNTDYESFPEYRGVTVVPLFVIKNPSEPGFEVHGNTVHVKNFGVVHLAELVISAYERRLTMLHVDLGSPLEGSVSGGSIGANGGHTDPP
jgi:hypothetical protein